MRKIILSIIACGSVVGLSNMPCQRISTKEALEIEKNRKWESMIKAITWVESRDDDNAKNPKSSALGRFQMLLIYVDEVNRILGEKRYKYEDRKDPDKAREMFDILQGYHNPEKDIDKAITLHRGLKSSSYIKEIKRNMKMKKI